MLPQVVQPGRARSARAGACSITRATAPRRLRPGTSHAIGKHHRGRRSAPASHPSSCRSATPGRSSPRPDGRRRGALEIGYMRVPVRLGSGSSFALDRHCGPRPWVGDQLSPRAVDMRYRGSTHVRAVSSASGAVSGPCCGRSGRRACRVSATGLASWERDGLAPRGELRRAG